MWALAAGRAVWEFFGGRIALQPWAPPPRGEPDVPVEVELAGPPPVDEPSRASVEA